MVRDQPYNITGDIYIGGKNSLTLTATLTNGTMSEVIIAIIPSLDSTILAVSKINTITTGSAVSMAGLPVPVNGYGVEYINNSKVKYVSRVTFNLGNVTVTGTTTTAAQRQIVINFELTMVSARNLTNGTTYLASSSISYKNINSLHAVQICQLTYTLRNTFMIPGSTTVTELPLSAIELGKQTLGNVTLYISKPAFNLSLEIYSTATNGEVVPTQLDVADAGEAFRSFLQFSGLKTNGYTSCNPNTTLRLEIQDLVNKESTAGGENADRDRLTVVVGYQTKYDPALLGQTFTVGLNVKVDSDATIVKSSLIQIIARASTPTFTGPITLRIQSGSVSVGFPAFLYLGIPVPSNTNKTYEITVTSTPLTVGIQPALSILAVKPFSYGSNLPCPYTQQYANITTSPTTNSTVTQLVTPFTILNSGIADVPEASLLTVVVTALFIKRADVATGNQHTLTVQVREKDGVSVSNSTILTVSNSTPFTSVVGYTLALSSNCPMSKSIQGGFVALNLTISTVVGIVSGPMLIEAAVVPNDTANALSFCSAKVVYAGGNVICIMAGIELRFSYVEGTSNRVALMELPCVCNSNLSSASTANDFIVEITFKLDEPYVAQNYSIGIAVNYSISQTWISEYTTFIESTKTILGSDGVYLITGMYVNTDNVSMTKWPESYVLQYQLGQDFITVPDTPNLWKKATSNSTSQEYLMNFPVFANVSRLTTANCKGGCYIAHSFRKTSASAVINAWGDNSGVLLLKLNAVFDGDNTTCFQVPIVGQDSPSVLLFKIFDLSLLNISATPFQINIVGQNIVCDLSSRPKNMFVAFPSAANLTNKFYGGITFCTAVTTAFGTECNLTCNCPSASLCAEILFFFWNDGDTTNPSKICEIRAVN
ncbi:hypothetical protein ACJMK2_015831 [Sinanodonta woodiana]|uniref:Uncharacterized protein n=1 Tax=Sinanodonta woodiana TaxID=1069815 RepID=A0ABD3UVF3_SINWO